MVAVEKENEMYTKTLRKRTRALHDKIYDLEYRINNNNKTEKSKMLNEKLTTNKISKNFNHTDSNNTYDENQTHCSQK